jgi:dephospho-CoA kinase
MLQLGLTGGLGSGKTFVGQTLEGYGCHLIQSDAVGHEVLLPGGEAYEPVVQEFGREILLDDGAIDRRKLAAAVFDRPERLERLNQLVHPAVRSRQEKAMQELRQTDSDGIVVVEAAILVETGSYKKFDRLIVVVCRLEQQIERAMKRGMSLEEVESRLKRQLPNEEKVRVADYVIDSSSSKEETAAQVRAVYEELRSIQV